MKIVITGGTGFIGLAIAEHLIASGHDCTLVARTATPKDFTAAFAVARTILADIVDGSAVRRIIQAERPDIIIHLAAVTPDRSTEMLDPAGIVQVNIGGTANVLHAASELASRPVVLLISSVAVYGAENPRDGSFHEDQTPLNPVSLYGVTKLAAENVARRLAQLYAIDLRTVRLGPVFGPWEFTSGLRPLLSPHSQILQLWKAGREAVLPRPLFADWLYSRDAGTAVSTIALAPRLEATTFNLGSGSVWSVADWCNGMQSTPFAGGWKIADAGEEPNVHLSLARDRAPLDITRVIQQADFRLRFTGTAAIHYYAEWLARYARNAG